jgi:N-acyl-D-aspartate/D-glutamate deacylase
MTSLPAQKIGAKDRGMIATGYHADIAVIDLNTLEAPASYEKANVYSRGVTHLFVNGVMEIEQGKATGKQGGKALRKTG